MTKLVGWYELAMRKINKYHLQYPLSAVRDLGLIQEKKMENDLTEKFIREMRKPAFKKLEASEEEE